QHRAEQHHPANSLFVRFCRCDNRPHARLQNALVVPSRAPLKPHCPSSTTVTAEPCVYRFTSVSGSEEMRDATRHFLSAVAGPRRHYIPIPKCRHATFLDGVHVSNKQTNRGRPASPPSGGSGFNSEVTLVRKRACAGSSRASITPMRSSPLENQAFEA